MVTNVAVLKDSMASLVSLKDDVVLMKVAVAAIHSDGLPENGAKSKVQVSEPKTFGGERSAKKLENFLWDIEQYLKAAQVPIAKCVNLASMYLEMLNSGGIHVTDPTLPEIDTWEALKKAMNEQFLRPIRLGQQEKFLGC